MRLFSPSTAARGAGLVGDRLPAPGNMPLILSSPSLFPLLPLYGLAEACLSCSWFSCGTEVMRKGGISQTGVVAGDGMRWGALPKA